MNSNLIITSIVSELPKVKGEIYEYRIDGGRILSKATSVLNNAVRLQLDELLPLVSKVLVSYSSVGLETRSKGIEFELLSIPGRVSQF